MTTNRPERTPGGYPPGVPPGLIAALDQERADQARHHLKVLAGAYREHVAAVRSLSDGTDPAQMDSLLNAVISFATNLREAGVGEHLRVGYIRRVLVETDIDVVRLRLMVAQLCDRLAEKEAGT